MILPVLITECKEYKHKSIATMKYQKPGKAQRQHQHSLLSTSPSLIPCLPLFFCKSHMYPYFTTKQDYKGRTEFKNRMISWARTCASLAQWLSYMEHSHHQKQRLGLSCNGEAN